MTGSASTTCASCGAAATGNFCASCGAPTGARHCTSCGTALSPGAKFCHRCGLGVGGVAGGGVPAQPGGSNTPWLIAGLLIVAVIGGVVYSANKRSQAPPPDMANAGNASGNTDPAGTGRAPDISNMSPRERFNRLVARISDALQRGDSATVISFTPMALGAYAQLPDSNRDIDARYQAAMLQAQVGMLDHAKALADTIMRGAPDNLLGFYLHGVVAEFGGDSAEAKAARAAFRAHYAAEMKKQRPEYAAHRQALDDYFKNGGGL